MSAGSSIVPAVPTTVFNRAITSDGPGLAVRVSVPSGALALQELAQLGLQDLAVGVLRQSVDEAVAFRALEAGDVVEAQAVEVGTRYARTLAADHEGDRLFAPVRMRPADHGRLQHAGVGQQHLLDLAG